MDTYIHIYIYSYIDLHIYIFTYTYMYICICIHVKCCVWNVMFYPCMIEKEQARWSWSPSWRCRKGSGNTTEGRRWSRLSFLSKVSLHLDHFARLGGTTIPKSPERWSHDQSLGPRGGTEHRVSQTRLERNVSLIVSWQGPVDQRKSQCLQSLQAFGNMNLGVWEKWTDLYWLYSFINCTHSTQQPFFEDVGHASGFVVAVLFSFIVLPWPLTRSRSFHVGLGLWLGPGLSSPS